jgi:hypothetical protein
VKTVALRREQNGSDPYDVAALAVEVRRLDDGHVISAQEGDVFESELDRRPIWCSSNLVRQCTEPGSCGSRSSVPWHGQQGSLNPAPEVTGAGSSMLDLPDVGDERCSSSPRVRLRYQPSSSIPDWQIRSINPPSAYPPTIDGVVQAHLPRGDGSRSLYRSQAGHAVPGMPERGKAGILAHARTDAGVRIQGTAVPQ